MKEAVTFGVGVVLVVGAMCGLGYALKRSEEEAAAKAPIADRCVQAQRFDRCMELLPAGPERTQYNDWDEVVESCNDVAREQAMTDRANVPKGCR